MKNLITSIACIMILLAFALQFTQNQILHTRITAINQAINSFKEVVKQEGKISDENEGFIKKELSKIAGCKEGEVLVNGDKKVLFRGEKIRYIITVPINDIISSAKFWGIGEEENKMNYTIDRYTTSECIGR